MRVLGSLISPTALGELIEQDWDLAAPVDLQPRPP